MPKVCLKCSQVRPKKDDWCSVCGERLVHETFLFRLFKVLGEVLTTLATGLIKAVGYIIVILLGLGVIALGAVVVIAVVKWAFEELAR